MIGGVSQAFSVGKRCFGSYAPLVPTVVRGSRRSGSVFDVVAPSGARIVVEAGAGDGPGGAAGPTPMELLLAALVTCAGSTFDDILVKMRRPAVALNVVAEAVRSERAPRVYTSISVEFHVAVPASTARLERALRLTEATCSAAVMLSSATALTSRIVDVRRVDPAVTRPLRQHILRPHQTLEELVTAGEGADGAAWMAAFDGDDVVGTVGLVPESLPEGGPEPALRLRAMATSTAKRGRGLGGVLLAAALDHAWSVGARRVWCSARTPAAGFYSAFGFVETSDVFEVDAIGPHVHMAIGRP